MAALVLAALVLAALVLAAPGRAQPDDPVLPMEWQLAHADIRIPTPSIGAASALMYSPEHPSKFKVAVYGGSPSTISDHC